MRSGKLDRQITIQRSSETINDAGTPVFAWSTIATARAQLLQQSTSEFIENHGATDETVVIFKTRFLQALRNTDRIIFDGVAHNIREVKTLGRDRGMEIRTITINEGAT